MRTASLSEKRIVTCLLTTKCPDGSLAVAERALTRVAINSKTLGESPNKKMYPSIGEFPNCAVHLHCNPLLSPVETVEMT
eukprot:247440-Pyramimonas_sp.AAC.2